MNPEMLLGGEFSFNVVVLVVTALLGIFAVASGLEGYFMRKLKWFEIILMLVGGILLIIPDILLSLAGLIIVAAIVAIQIIERWRDNHNPAKSIKGIATVVSLAAAVLVVLVIVPAKDSFHKLRFFKTRLRTNFHYWN